MKISIYPPANRPLSYCHLAHLPVTHLAPKASSHDDIPATAVCYDDLAQKSHK